MNIGSTISINLSNTREPLTRDIEMAITSRKDHAIEEQVHIPLIGLSENPGPTTHKVASCWNSYTKLLTEGYCQSEAICYLSSTVGGGLIGGLAGNYLFEDLGVTFISVALGLTIGMAGATLRIAHLSELNQRV